MLGVAQRTARGAPGYALEDMLLPGGGDRHPNAYGHRCVSVARQPWPVQPRGDCLASGTSLAPVLHVGTAGNSAAMTRPGPRRL